MYFEDFSDIRNAIAREKQLKNWQRSWKIELIRKENPDLIDLAKDWYKEKIQSLLRATNSPFPAGLVFERREVRAEMILHRYFMDTP